MSARNMVRDLRDSGVLAAPPPAPNWRSNVVFFTAALACGAVLYLAVVYGLPAFIHAMEKPPPPVSYVKPDRA
jgi:hypothetical protein